MPERIVLYVVWVKDANDAPCGDPIAIYDCLDKVRKMKTSKLVDLFVSTYTLNDPTDVSHQFILNKREGI